MPSSVTICVKLNLKKLSKGFINRLVNYIMKISNFLL